MSKPEAGKAKSMSGTGAAAGRHNTAGMGSAGSTGNGLRNIVRMSGVRIVSSLWRGNRRLQLLNGAANMAAMTLIFVLAWAVNSVPSVAGDLGTFLVFMVVAAVLIDKTTTDHAFIAKWSDLMRLRMMGATPRWLIRAMIGVQLPVAFVSALGACVLGVPGNALFYFFFRLIGTDAVKRTGSGFFNAVWQTVLISLVCAMVSAYFSGRKVGKSRLVLSAVPERATRRSVYTRFSNIVRNLITVAMFVVGIGWGIVSSRSNSDAAQVGNGVMPLLVCWGIARLAKPMLRAIGGGISRWMRGRSWADIALRDVTALKSVSIFSITVVAVAVFVFFYGMQTFQDHAANTSLHAIFDGTSVMETRQAGKAGTRNLRALAREADPRALVLAPTTQVRYLYSDTGGCDKQMKEDLTGGFPLGEGLSSVIDSGSLSDFIPVGARQGDVDARNGVVSAGESKIGQPVCIAGADGHWHRSKVTSIIRMGGGMTGNLYVPRSLNPAENQHGHRMAIIHHDRTVRAHGLVSDTGSRSVSVSSTGDVIDRLPFGAVSQREFAGGNRVGVYFFVYPILLISVVGLVSVVANDAESRRREARAAWMIGMSGRQWAMSGCIRTGIEVGTAGLLSMVAVVISVNLTEQPRLSEYWHAARVYVPWPQLGMMALALLIVIGCGGLLYRSVYRGVVRNGGR
ncbi:hypothetical protein OZX73_03275 [Bifidobacterium sp. ESL0775]|uniref:hypothetical protein n=1 Tax=Bifidobacterium sp. ESL0775 TaxID=2983230 RepID=UPI0023F8E4BF|nr:hypothetical protein [Bifidobacterium sp. ESL0775]WEV69898.1 hypothetical protein OZX73_03275 [Bifidobacterium sp. ESL0775]